MKIAIATILHLIVVININTIKLSIYISYFKNYILYNLLLILILRNFNFTKTFSFFKQTNNKCLFCDTHNI